MSAAVRCLQRASKNNLRLQNDVAMGYTKHMIPKIRSIVLHPALLFAFGNTALAVGHAEAIAIGLNIGLVFAILIARYVETVKKKPFGIPFSILAVVNFITAGSVIYSNLAGSKTELLDYVAVFAYLAWGIGHLLAGWHERRRSSAKRISENPQVFYGVGDMLAVNASGSINPFSFPFMVTGFIKSIFIGKQVKAKNKSIQFINSEITAARLYGFGFIVGAVTSVAVPYFFVAQVCWALGYFQFKKDT